MYAKKFMKKYGHGGEVEKKMSYYKEGGEVGTEPEIGSLMYDEERKRFLKYAGEKRGYIPGPTIAGVVQDYSDAGLLVDPESGSLRGGDGGEVNRIQDIMIRAFQDGDLDTAVSFINASRGDAARAIVPNIPYRAADEMNKADTPVGKAKQSQREAAARVMRQGTNEEDSQKELVRRAQMAAEEEYRSGKINTRR